MNEDQRLHLDAPAQIKSSDFKYSAPLPGAIEQGDARYPITPPVDLGEPRHFFDYVRVVYKRRWLTGTVFAIVSVSTALYTYTRVPVYQATTRLLIDPQRQNYGFTEVAQGDSRVDYQMQYAILRSRSLVKKTMQNLGIWHDAAAAEAAPPPAPPNESLFKEVYNFVTGLIESSAPKPTGIEARAVTESAAEARQIDGFGSGLTVSPLPSSGIVDVTYTGSNPVTVARYANAVAKAYVDQNLEVKSKAVKDVSDWLSERLVEQRAKVQASEDALQKYREQNDVVALDEHGTLIVKGLNELQTSVTKARTERIERETAFNQLKTIQSDPAAIADFPPIATSAGVVQAKNELASAQRVVNQLSQTLLDKHPDLVAARENVRNAQEKVAAEVAKAADAIRVEFEKAKTTEEGLSQTLDEQKKQALETSGSGVELNVLMRDLDSNRQVYNTMMERAKQADITGEIKTNNIRILDVAEVPRWPVSPNTRKDMQYGILGGFVLAIGLAFLFEYLDNRIKAPEEIRTYLGVPFLGLLPAAPVGEGARQQTPLLNSGVPPRFAEAFRIVRTNVLFSSPDEGARSVLVSSAGPGEGKTCVTCNLAIAIAQTGQRVLVIDTDLRRPRVHEVFNVRQEPGLSNLIVGDAKPSDVIKTSTAGVTVLPAGKIPPNPAELLGSKRFRELFARLSEHFDWIIVDSPPVMAVTDASVVAHMVSGVMFVVSSEMTNRHAAKSAIDQLSAARARVIGAVLNRVHLERHPYYYAKYYRREYSEYYVAKV